MTVITYNLFSLLFIKEACIKKVNHGALSDMVSIIFVIGGVYIIDYHFNEIH